MLYEEEYVQIRAGLSGGKSVKKNGIGDEKQELIDEEAVEVKGNFDICATLICVKVIKYR